MPSAAQSVLNSIQRSLSKPGPPGPGRRLLLKAKFGLRRAILLLHDPPVTHQAGLYQLRMPFSHNLSIDDAASPGRSDNLARIAERVLMSRGDLHFIDVGANVGDTIAVLRNRCHFPILGIEGDDEFYPFLESNMTAFPDVVTFKALLGERAEEVPGTMMTNYGGSKQVTISPGSQDSLRFSTLPEVVNRFPDFQSPGMIKIDTDGYDCKIIRGAIGWLRESRPVIFFEYDPHHLAEQGDEGISIFGQLRSIGYESALIFEGNSEFMFSFGLEQDTLIKELHYYFSGRLSKLYADVCVFHEQDRSLFEECRAMELEHAIRSLG